MIWECIIAKNTNDPHVSCATYARGKKKKKYRRTRSSRTERTDWTDGRGRLLSCRLCRVTDTLTRCINIRATTYRPTRRRGVPSSKTRTAYGVMSKHVCDGIARSQAGCSVLRSGESSTQFWRGAKVRGIGLKVRIEISLKIWIFGVQYLVFRVRDKWLHCPPPWIRRWFYDLQRWPDRAGEIKFCRSG